MDLVPRLVVRERPDDHERDDHEGDQDEHVCDAAGLEVLEPFLDPRLAQPPTGDPLLGEVDRDGVPDGHADEGDEEQPDQPGGDELSLGQDGAHEQQGPYEAGEDPQDAQVHVL